MIGKVWKKQGGAGGGDIVNGIIEQYKASTSTIDANSFVEFVNSKNVEIGDTYQIYDTFSSPKPTTSAIQVSKNKIFLLYNGNNALRSVICTISGTTITLGTETIIETNSSYTYPIFSGALINDNKVLVAYALQSVSGYAYSVVCTISGTTITIGTKSNYISSALANIAVITLESDKAIVIYGRRPSSDYVEIHGRICTISGTTITLGTDKTINSHSYSGTVISAKLIDTNKVFIAHTYSYNYNLYAQVCTISGTTITVGSDTSLVTTANSGSNNIQAVTVDTNKVVVFHQKDNTRSLNYMFCTISGTTITKYTDGAFNSTSNTADNANAIYKGDRLYIYYSVSNTLKVYTANINGTSFSNAKTTTLISSVFASYCPIMLAIANDNAIFVNWFPSNQGVKAAITPTPPDIKESTTKINGLTKTQATTSTAGDVWILNQ